MTPCISPTKTVTTLEYQQLSYLSSFKCDYKTFFFTEALRDHVKSFKNKSNTNQYSMSCFKTDDLFPLYDMPS